MTFISPVFSLETLQKTQGYSLQAFASGRFKLTFHAANSRRFEYYAVAPKRDREAYRRQTLRSEHLCPEHFQVVETLLLERSRSRIFRLHEKTNSNDTADNAHLLLDMDKREACVVLRDVIHLWPLPTEVLTEVSRAKGAQRGEASIFNEYLRTYEHEWTTYQLHHDDYAQGYREPVQYKALRSPTNPWPASTDEDYLF